MKEFLLIVYLSSFKGPEEIQKFFTEKVPATSHQIHSYDAQPVLDEFVGGQKTVMVHVGGTVKFANDSR